MFISKRTKHRLDQFILCPISTFDDHLITKYIVVGVVLLIVFLSFVLCYCYKSNDYSGPLKKMRGRRGKKNEKQNKNKMKNLGGKASTATANIAWTPATHFTGSSVLTSPIPTNTAPSTTINRLKPGPVT